MSLAFVQKIARKAGAFLRTQQGHIRRQDIARKSSWRDLVTKADIASERMLVKEIRAKFPKHAIFSEEETKEWDMDRPLWLIDPIDGTINFVHGHPHFAVSIGVYVGGKPKYGVVYNPIIDELFSAEVGKGATLNGKRIKVSTEKKLADSLLATGFPYLRNRIANNNLNNFSQLSLEVRGIRRIGVASLDLAYVACGRFDGFWELHLQPYDVAAGALIVREAGGKVTDFEAKDSWLRSGNIIATNGKIHEGIRKRLIP